MDTAAAYIYDICTCNGETASMAEKLAESDAIFEFLMNDDGAIRDPSCLDYYFLEKTVFWPRFDFDLDFIFSVDLASVFKCSALP